jgi:hypothetical protein
VACFRGSLAAALYRKIPPRKHGTANQQDPVFTGFA